MCIISLKKVTGVVYTPGKMFNIECRKRFSLGGGTTVQGESVYKITITFPEE